MKLSPVIIVAILMAVASCGVKKDKGDVYSRIHSSTNYSDSFLTASDITTFLNSIKADTSLKRQVNEFYTQRDYQMAWFVSGDLTSTAGNFYEKLSEHTYALNDSNVLYQQLFSVWNNSSSHKVNNMLSPAVNLELLLTACFFKYAEKAYSGSVKNLKTLEWYIPRKKKNFVATLDALVAGELTDEQMDINSFYAMLKDYLIKYRKIENSGGWPKISHSLENIKQGDTSAAVPDLKKFLMTTGDASGTDLSHEYNEYAREGVLSFQRRMGLDKTGIPDKATIDEMNVPVEKRIHQIMVNMERMRWFNAPDRTMDFIVVNIPAFKLLVLEKGKLQWDMNVVVGTTANRTTVFQGSISQVVINPYWNVPESIINNEMLEKFQANANGFAESENLEILVNEKPVSASSVDWSDPEEVSKVRIRQQPGDKNALGRYKFLFPNSFSIYLHDSPAKHLFDKDVRSFSHGCIRVEDPGKLARYLLRKDRSWNESRIQEALDNGEEQSIKVDPPLPVYIVYFTSWVNNDKMLCFRKDIYGHDKKLEEELFVNEKLISGK
jgi:L,D-transpeptidase YcbB